MYMVSACLVGINCRYDGRNTLDEKLAELVREGRAIPLCPEVLGGIPTPRESCEIQLTEDGRRMVMSREGTNCTREYTEGARRTLEICRIAGIRKAILQQRSPSCGCGRIYDGTFSSRLIDGNGITAEMLKANGISVYTAETWEAES